MAMLHFAGASMVMHHRALEESDYLGSDGWFEQQGCFFSVIMASATAVSAFRSG